MSVHQSSEAMQPGLVTRGRQSRESIAIEMLETAQLSTMQKDNQSPNIENVSSAIIPVVTSTQILTRIATFLSMVSLCVAVLLSALDVTIVATALPSIVADFHSSAGYTWVGGAFILSSAAVTPIWGSVSDIWGRKPIMLIAVAVFLIGSLLCALAPRIDILIAGRAIQGAGAAGIGILVNIIICDMFSMRDRSLYLAISSLMWAVGSAIGPVLGGVFVTRLTWRWCLWINMPIGSVVVVVLLLFLKVQSPNTPVIAGLKAIDWPGSLLIVGGALMILLGINFGDVEYSWSSSTVICLIVIGTVTIGVFIFNEWKVANPIIPLRLFSSPSTVAVYGVFACNFYVFIGLAYYLPLYSQSVLGVDALRSGLYLMPLIISSSLAAAAAGIFIQQTGKYLPMMWAAQVMLTLGVGLFVNLKFEENLTKLFLFQIIVGIGVGMNIDAPILAAQAATTSLDTAAVTGTMGFLRNIANAISIVIGGVVFQNEMKMVNHKLVGDLGLQLATNFSGGQASANVDFIGTLPTNQQVIVRRAYYDLLRTVWMMYVAFAGLAFFLNLFVRSHHLSRETNAAILGVDRKLPPQQPGILHPTSMAPVQGDDSQR